MATKKRAAAKKRPPTISRAAAKKLNNGQGPMTAEMKAAKAGLVRGQQLGLAATAARAAQVAKGAYSGVKVRAGGSDLDRYQIGMPKGDPFPKPKLPKVPKMPALPPPPKATNTAAARKRAERAAARRKAAAEAAKARRYRHQRRKLRNANEAAQSQNSAVVPPSVLGPKLF